MPNDTEVRASGSFTQHMDYLAAAFALTRGSQHTLVYANSAFRHLVSPEAELLLGSPVPAALALRDAQGFTALLDRAFRTGVVARNRRIDLLRESELPLTCTIWPDVHANGQPQHLLIELRVATPGEVTLKLQREVAERLLLGALREKDAADSAEASRRSAAFLAAESRRLAESLDEDTTLAAMERMSLPHVGAWCIVDMLDDDDSMHRLAIIHPDPAKQAILAELDGRWIPEVDDAFGLPAVLRDPRPTFVASGIGGALGSTSRDQDVDDALKVAGAGPLLTVPLVVRDRLIGAVTFVAEPQHGAFTSEEMKIAEDLAIRSAMALDRARLYGEAVALKVRAESASRAKTAFLAMMSHELRTPLNAIGGYVDLIDLEIHGPVTDAQRADLARIRSNQRYLMGLINDLLNLTRIGSGHLEYDTGEIAAHEVIAASVALVEPLIAQKGLIQEAIACSTTAVMRGDREKVIQILVNLLSNAIKFTPAGGRLVIDCLTSEDAVMLRVCDTGIGIPANKLDAIFEPFVQVKGGSLGPEAGIGLGLAISRSLARAMQGDLTVESTLGEGARFTLSLPRSWDPARVNVP